MVPHHLNRSSLIILNIGTQFNTHYRTRIRHDIEIHYRTRDLTTNSGLDAYWQTDNFIWIHYTPARSLPSSNVRIWIVSLLVLH